jgi:hypothetical protein
MADALAGPANVQASAAVQGTSIDRQALVTRHKPAITVYLAVECGRSNGQNAPHASRPTGCRRAGAHVHPADIAYRNGWHRHTAPARLPS